MEEVVEEVTSKEKHRLVKPGARALIRKLNPKISKKPKHFKITPHIGRSTPGKKFRFPPPSVHTWDINAYCEIYEVKRHTTKD